VTRWRHYTGRGDEQVVQLEDAVSARVVAVAGANLALLGPCRRSGGVLCRLSAHAGCWWPPCTNMYPLQGAPERLHPQLPRSVQLSLSGKLLFWLVSILWKVFYSSHSHRYKEVSLDVKLLKGMLHLAQIIRMYSVGFVVGEALLIHPYISPMLPVIFTVADGGAKGEI